MKKLLIPILLIAGVGLILHGIFGLEKKHKKHFEEGLDRNLPWVQKCAGPPPPYHVVTNETGSYALIRDDIGVLDGSISPTRQGAINYGWQYVMFVAHQAAQPAPKPEVWVKSE